MNDKYVPYLEIASCLDLKKGDRIYLSSDIMAISYMAQLNGEKFDMNRFIDSFMDVLSLEGTLLIPTFNFQFSNKGTYDYRKSPSTTGALGNAALHRKDFKRTKHPMHSFSVWGKDKEYLCNMENLNSFGDDSPFAYMKDRNVIQIMLGTDYQRSMTFVHYVENKANVPYRFYKEFKGNYIDENGIETERIYEYPARNLELGSVEKFNRIGMILEDKTISHKYIIDRVPIIRASLKESYDVIYEDAKNNMCKNLYDFDYDRETIWK